MPTKELKISSSSGTIVIGDYPVTSDMIDNPFNNLIRLNFHSSLPYLTVKQYINFGGVSVPAGPPTYSFDEQQYTTVSTTNLSMPSAGVNFLLFLLVVNGVGYPGGYYYNESASGHGRIHLTASGESVGSNIYLRRTVTTHTNTVGSIYLSSVEALLIG